MSEQKIQGDESQELAGGSSGFPKTPELESLGNFFYQSAIQRHGVETADWLAQEFGWKPDRKGLVQQLESLATEIRSSKAAKHYD